MSEIAPCWQGDTGQREGANLGLPSPDPVAPSGYFPVEAFQLDDYCRLRSVGATGEDEHSLLDCQRDMCKGVYPPDGVVHGRTSWSRMETERCVSEYAARYDRLCAAFGEPVLNGIQDGVSVFRLYREAATSPFHLMVRVVMDKSGATIVTKRMEARESSSRGRLLWQRTRQLTQRELGELVAAIVKAGFWSLPSRVRSSRTQFDGYGYTLEGANGKTRHLVSSGVPEGALGDLLAHMVSLSECPDAGGSM